MTPFPGHYDIALVVLSVLVAMLAAGAAVHLSGRVVATSGNARRLWLTGGAVALGSGIWSMHYAGMRAFQLPVPVRYHVPVVLISLLAAIAASGVALVVASRERLGPVRLALRRTRDSHFRNRRKGSPRRSFSMCFRRD